MDLAPCFLVASPALLDPNFARTVVMLVAHTEDGAIGFVINRPLTGLTVERVLRELGAPCEHPRPGPVLSGGPVQREVGFVVADRREVHEPLMGDGFDVGPAMVVSSSRSALELLGRPDGAERSHLMLGYAGWGPGQLEGEISEGVWIPADLDVKLVFDTPMAQRWERAYESFGTHPGRVVRTVGQA